MDLCTKSFEQCVHAVKNRSLQKVVTLPFELTARIIGVMRVVTPQLYEFIRKFSRKIFFNLLQQFNLIFESISVAHL